MTNYKEYWNKIKQQHNIIKVVCGGYRADFRAPYTIYDMHWMSAKKYNDNFKCWDLYLICKTTTGYMTVIIHKLPNSNFCERSFCKDNQFYWRNPSTHKWKVAGNCLYITM